MTQAGFTVAVYERDDRIGGLLRYGIPDFKLEKSVVDRRLDVMAAEGTRFRTGIEIGKDITWDVLRRRYDAVIVATGATRPRELDIPGRKLQGIHHAMDYLVRSNRLSAGDEVADLIDARGKNVIVPPPSSASLSTQPNLSLSILCTFKRSSTPFPRTLPLHLKCSNVRSKRVSPQSGTLMTLSLPKKTSKPSLKKPDIGV